MPETLRSLSRYAPLTETLCSALDMSDPHQRCSASVRKCSALMWSAVCWSAPMGHRTQLPFPWYTCAPAIPMAHMCSCFPYGVYTLLSSPWCACAVIFPMACTHGWLPSPLCAHARNTHLPKNTSTPISGIETFPYQSGFLLSFPHGVLAETAGA